MCIQMHRRSWCRDIQSLTSASFRAGCPHTYTLVVMCYPPEIRASRKRDWGIDWSETGGRTGQTSDTPRVRCLPAESQWCRQARSNSTGVFSRLISPNNEWFYVFILLLRQKLKGWSKNVTLKITSGSEITSLKITLHVTLRKFQGVIALMTALLFVYYVLPQNIIVYYYAWFVIIVFFLSFLFIISWKKYKHKYCKNILKKFGTVVFENCMHRFTPLRRNFLT